MNSIADIYWALCSIWDPGNLVHLIIDSVWRAFLYRFLFPILYSFTEHESFSLFLFISNSYSSCFLAVFALPKACSQLFNSAKGLEYYLRHCQVLCRIVALKNLLKPVHFLYICYFKNIKPSFTLRQYLERPFFIFRTQQSSTTKLNGFCRQNSRFVCFSLTMTSSILQLLTFSEYAIPYTIFPQDKLEWKLTSLLYLRKIKLIHCVGKLKLSNNSTTDTPGVMNTAETIWLSPRYTKWVLCFIKAWESSCFIQCAMIEQYVYIIPIC